jgi:hypothetical protein
MKTASGGGIPRGGRRHVLVRSYLAITSRSRHPEGATPGLWTWVAWARGAWSCMQGKPPLGNGAIVFSGAFRARGAGRFRARGPDRFRAGADRGRFRAGADRGRFRAGGRPDYGPNGVDAAFMLFERGVGWLAGAVARVIWGAGRASVTVASPVPRLTMWMPRSFCKSCMNEASTSYGRVARTSRRGISSYGSSSGAQGHQR